MLDNLLEIELAYSLMKTDDQSYQDPIDVHYAKLNTDIEVLVHIVYVWTRGLKCQYIIFLYLIYFEY